MKTSWKELVREAIAVNGESLTDIVATTLGRKQFEAEFADNTPFPHGKPFTAWSKNFVYFPAVKISVGPDGEIDLSEYVASAPRHVQRSVAVRHVGYG